MPGFTADLARAVIGETHTEGYGSTMWTCDTCGLGDYINYVKEPSEQPDCHMSYCGKCWAVVCEECAEIGHNTEIDDDDIYCPGCVPMPPTTAG